MSTSTISIEVDADAARAFAEATAADQRKLQLLLNLRLRELTMKPRRSIQEIMDAIGNRAESLGMTPELLESLLNGD